MKLLNVVIVLVLLLYLFKIIWYFFKIFDIFLLKYKFFYLKGWIWRDNDVKIVNDLEKKRMGFYINKWYSKIKEIF